MNDSSNPITPEFVGFLFELFRVCPEAADGLVFPGEQPPALSVRYRIEILRTLPDQAGVDAFLAAWNAFVAANPATVASPSALYEPDFYHVRGSEQPIAVRVTVWATDD